MATATIVQKWKRRNRNAWTELAVGVESKAAMIAYNYARTTVANAKRIAPVRTGYLRSSIQWVRIGPGHYRIFVGAYYAIYVEYGTRYMRAQPFLRPSLRAAKQIYDVEIRRIFR